MRRKGLGSMIVFLFAFFCLVGMAWGEQRGVTDTTIKIATHMALTGPAALVGKPIADGQRMYFEDLNEKGGVHGRKIIFIAEDDQFLPSRAKETVKKLIAKDQVYAILAPLQGAGTLAAIPDINKAKLPVLFCMTALDTLFVPTRRYIFGWCIPYQDSTALWVQWAHEALKTKKFAAVPAGSPH